MAKMLLVNPKKRRSKRKVKRKSPAKRRRVSSVTRKTVTKRYKRNPIRRKKSGIGGILKETVVPSAIAAGGALGLDVAMGYLPLPENLKTGPMRHLVKGAGAIGLGMLAGMFLKPKTAELITTGALTVTLHDAGKEAMGRFVPNVRLASIDDELESLSYVSPGMPVGEYLDEYVPGNTMDNSMGEYLDGVSIEEDLEL